MKDQVENRFEPGRWRNAGALQEFDERLVAFGDEPETAFQILARRGEDFIEDPPLLVFEQGLERIRSLAEMPIHDTNRFGKIRTLIGRFDLADHAIVAFCRIELPDTTVAV